MQSDASRASALAASGLLQKLDQQRKPTPRPRYEPTLVYLLAERVKSQGIDLRATDGPWYVGAQTLPRLGRNNLSVIPLITNGQTKVMVDTPEHAADVAGLLNWCGVEDLEPVPRLNPQRLERTTPLLH